MPSIRQTGSATGLNIEALYYCEKLDLREAIDRDHIDYFELTLTSVQLI